MRHLSEYIEALGPLTSRSVYWAYYQNLGKLHNLEIELLITLDSEVFRIQYHEIGNYGFPYGLSFEDFLNKLTDSEKDKFLFHLDLFL